MKYKVLSKIEIDYEFKRKNIIAKPRQLICLHKSKGKPYFIAISSDDYCHNVCNEECKWSWKNRKEI